MPHCPHPPPAVPPGFGIGTGVGVGAPGFGSGIPPLGVSHPAVADERYALASAVRRLMFDRYSAPRLNESPHLSPWAFQVNPRPVSYPPRCGIR